MSAWRLILWSLMFLGTINETFAKTMTIDEMDAKAADTKPFDNDGTDDPTALWDPLEPVNRFVFEVNRRVDGAILKPVAQVYKDITPEPLQKGVTNFLDNLWFPVNFVNFVLQGRLEQAGKSLCRFFLNTTMGVGGLFDPAAEFGIAKENTGFGDTLGSWGLKPGAYLMLPVIGPSSVQDFAGKIVDQGAHPLRVWTYNTKAHKHQNKHHQLRHWYDGSKIVEFTSVRKDYLKSLSDLEENSLDYYVAVRSLHGQKLYAAQQRIDKDRKKIMADPEVDVKAPKKPEDASPKKHQSG